MWDIPPPPSGCFFPHFLIFSLLPLSLFSSNGAEKELDRGNDYQAAPGMDPDGVIDVRLSLKLYFLRFFSNVFIHRAIGMK